jgi:hypothetical protein
MKRIGMNFLALVVATPASPLLVHLEAVKAVPEKSEFIRRTVAV